MQKKSKILFITIIFLHIIGFIYQTISGNFYLVGSFEYLTQLANSYS